jgi:LuxR family quorum-sensing system transcriptional regulator CciR
VSETRAPKGPDEDSHAQAASRGRIVQDFTRAARISTDLAQLRDGLCAAVWALGFDHMLLQGANGALWLADLPPAWQVRPAGDGDAVLAAAALSYAPFLWSDILRLVAMSDAQRDHLSEAVAAGVGAAISVPIHRPMLANEPANESGSYSRFAGLCSFLMKNGAPLPLGSLAAAHYIGALAFDAAEQLRHAAVTPSPFRHTAPRLTPRQRDCVVLVAQGKSDWEIGRLLGISESTVHKHIEDAKRRFVVSTRIQLVVRSLFDARLSFSDVMAAEVALPQAAASSTCTTSVRETAKAAAQIPR